MKNFRRCLLLTVIVLAAACSVTVAVRIYRGKYAPRYLEVQGGKKPASGNH